MYSLESNFDMEKHKQTYIHYLEVVIFPDGHVEYAVPSHQEKLISICMEELKISRETLYDMCPEEYYFDFMVWMCNLCKCIVVWTDFYKKSDKHALTNAQWNTLNQLKTMGIYEGEI